MNKNQKTRVTSTLISEVTGKPDSSIRASWNGRLKNEVDNKLIEKATAYMENEMETVVGKAKKKFSKQ